MKTIYKTIKVKTEKDLKEAEKLKEKGWILYSSGLFTLHFYKTEEK